MQLLHVIPAAVLLWPAVDAIARWLRLLSAEPGSPAVHRVERPLLVIPSRAEGLLAKPLCEDALGQGVVPVVILDGDDPTARAELTALGARVLVKEPAGPTKGAALAWFTENLGAEIDAASHVLVFDADMRLPEGYFAGLRVPEEAAVFQGPVRTSGVPAAGAARVEALSTAVATLADDPARTASGLPVRLRGKAMGFTPAAWRTGPGAGAATTAEDSEFTFRLLGKGYRVHALAGPLAFEEPAGGANAMAAPRARWFAGTLRLLVAEPALLARLLVTKPWGTLVLAADVFLRPRALVLLFQLAAAVAATVALTLGLGNAWTLAALVLALAGLLAERLAVAAARRRLGFPAEIPPVTFGDLVALLAVWMRALGKAARAPSRWHRARPEARV